MFNSAYNYLASIVDTPFNNFKFNIFFFMNIRVFKLKLNNFIMYMILGINSLAFRKIKVFYHLDNFLLYYFYLIILTLTIVVYIFILFYFY